MKNFGYIRAATVNDVVNELAVSGRDTLVLSGGMDLLDLLKEELVTPDVMVSLAQVQGLESITVAADGKTTIGARVTLASLASNSDLQSRYGVLADAAAKAATPQIRNRATIGGNILQRPRCWYFRKHEFDCLKKGGNSCPGAAGENRYLAVLGGGPCYAVHASSLAVALVALDATAAISRPGGSRTSLVKDLFVSPGEDPTREHRLADNEVITSFQLPAPRVGSTNTYVKVRHKEAWDWAMAEAAVQLVVSGGLITDARVVLGGVAPIPWRSTDAEGVLKGKAPSTALMAQAANAAVAATRPLSDNAYKVPAAYHVVEQALLNAAGLAS